MFELRILSGLHRGATLPLIDESLSIGSSDDADVVLLDDGIASLHASLTKTEQGWLLHQDQGDIFSAFSLVTHTLLDLLEGDFARVGPVWIAIVRADSAWENPPPMPTDDDISGSAQSAKLIETELPEPADSVAIDSSTLQTDTTLPVRKRGKRCGRQFKRLMLIALASTAVLSAAAYAISGKTNVAGKASPLAIQPAVLALKQEQLRKAFKKRMSDADLLQHLELQFGEQAWSIRADLDEEQSRRFERILKAFLLEHKVSFPVHAKLLSAEELLPFKIRQVISGTNASVVTQDGQRLFVGEELDGVRLLAVQDNRLTFAGKRKIEVSW